MNRKRILISTTSDETLKCHSSLISFDDPREIDGFGFFVSLGMKQPALHEVLICSRGRY